MTQPPRYLTASQVAKIFDVGPETVRRWVRQEKLNAVILPSGRMKFLQEDIDAIQEPRQPVAS